MKIIDRGIERQVLRELAGAMATIRNPETMLRCLDELLTPAERYALSLRWELMRRLRRGDKQRVIAEELHVSLCKITRGSKILKTPHAVSVRMLEKTYKNDKLDR